VVEEGESDEDSQDDDSDDEFENEEPELIEPRSPTFHDEEQSSDESGQSNRDQSNGHEDEAPRARRFVAEPDRDGHDDHNGHDEHNGEAEEEEIVEQLGGDAMDETPYRQPRLAPPIQDSGSHQAPPGAADSGRQGRARQQGRGSDHLSVAGRPLFGG